MNDMIILTKKAGKKANSVFIDFNCFPNLPDLYRFSPKQVPMMIVYNLERKGYVRPEVRTNIYDGSEVLEGALNSKYDSRFRASELTLGYNSCQEYTQEPETEEPRKGDL